MPFDVHAPLDMMGPCVPRYVTTGCSTLLATGFALAMPATSSTLVSRDVKETILVRLEGQIKRAEIWGKLEVAGVSLMVGSRGLIAVHQPHACQYSSHPSSAV